MKYQKHTLAILFSLFVLFFVLVSGCVQTETPPIRNAIEVYSSGLQMPSVEDVRSMFVINFDDILAGTLNAYTQTPELTNVTIYAESKQIIDSVIDWNSNDPRIEIDNKDNVNGFWVYDKKEMYQVTIVSSNLNEKTCYLVYLVYTDGKIYFARAYQKPSSNNTQIANPASEYCVNNGGTLEIVNAMDGSQYGVCTIGEIQCEEWAFFRGECPSKYDVAEMTNVTCERDYECETPMDYLLRSNCPYTSKCINQTCAVICSKFVNEQYLDVVEHECLPEQRGEVACTMDYNPVCGWFNQSIQCIRYPCAATYGNGCGACADEKVEFWTRGECPN